MFIPNKTLNMPYKIQLFWKKKTELKCSKVNLKQKIEHRRHGTNINKEFSNDFDVPPLPLVYDSTAVLFMFVKMKLLSSVIPFYRKTFAVYSISQTPKKYNSILCDQSRDGKFNIRRQAYYVIEINILCKYHNTLWSNCVLIIIIICIFNFVIMYPICYHEKIVFKY